LTVENDYFLSGGKIKIQVRGIAMKGLLLIVGVVVVWFLPQAVILPNFGVQT
jgi:hypothetical protein